MAKLLFKEFKNLKDVDEAMEINFYLLFAKYEDASNVSTSNDLRQEIIKIKTLNEKINQTLKSRNKNDNETIQPTQNTTNYTYNQDQGNEEEASNDNQYPNNNVKINEINNTANQSFCILSIDGGGIKGIIPLFLLREIEIRTGRGVGDLFQMFCGTSIGGIIALILSQGRLTADALIKKMLGSFKNKIFKNKSCINLFRKRIEV